MKQNKTFNIKQTLTKVKDLRAHAQRVEKNLTLYLISFAKRLKSPIRKQETRAYCLAD